MSITSVLFTVGLSLQALAAAVEVPTPVSQILVPQGFTEAENAVVILSGAFPNTCFEVGAYTTAIDSLRKQIVIDAKSTTEKDVPCALRMVPFAQAVQLGKLEPGEYKLTLANGDAVQSQPLVIAPRSVSSDNRTFASVRKANIETSPDGTQTLSLTGNYPLTFVGCALLSKIELSTPSEHFLVVEPLVTLHTDTAPCANWSPTFNISYELPTPLPEGGMVVYIKTADGAGLTIVKPIERPLEE